jgi:hypothetical protein
MRSQKITKETPKKQTVVISDKKPKVKPPPKVKEGVTLRTIHFVEVGDLAPQNIQLFVQELNATYNPAEHGIHFVVPVRYGKIGDDIVFEDEFLSVTDKICEVVDENGNTLHNAKIQLKGGAKEIQVIRQKV